MKSRIKELREYLGMNQEEFGSNIGVRRSTVANYETGSRIPLDSVITSICREYGCCRAWLEDGILPMFPESKDEDIQKITRAMEGMSENKKKLMRLLADMPDELLDRFMEYLERKK